MLFWLEEMFIKFYENALTVLDKVTVFLEWYSHTDDIRASEPCAGREQMLPVFEDDGAAYVEDPDFFYDEYVWEGNNNMM